jgi:small-conductance mechanosensitive channel
MALASSGIDFTALALFSGTLGVSLGFGGLQTMISNLISDITLFDGQIYQTRPRDSDR